MATRERLNRADAIRRRREKEAEGSVASNPARPARNAAVMQNTPVLTRQGAIGRPVVQRARTQVKRKVALPMRNGTELVIPGLPVLSFGWRLASAVLALFLGTFILIFTSTDYFLVSTLSISGLRRVNAADIAGVLGLGGTPSYMLNPDQITLEIETNFPEFYNVEVTIDFPAVVNISLREREPVIAWNYDTLTLWVDREGNVFTPRGKADDLITINSSEAPPRIQVLMTDREIEIARELGRLESDEEVLMKDGPMDPELVQQILTLHDRMPEITWLSYNPKSGYGWNDDKYDWNIFFGHDLNNLDQKLLLYDAIKDYVMEKNISINTISVAFTQAPFYRVE